MTRLEAITALMTGQPICNAAWGPGRWVNIEDPSVVDVLAADWDKLLGAESDEYRVYDGPM